MFELYNAPSVTYGIDSLFAFSRQKHEDGLAVSLGHNASTIIPVVNGRGVLSRAKRWVMREFTLTKGSHEAFRGVVNKPLSSCSSLPS
jgi:actin-related protein